MKYGTKEIAEIQNVIPNIQEALKESRRRHLVKSEYSIAQFTNGNKDNKLAYLCVPDENNDCDVVREILLSEFHTCTVKHEQSALSSVEFLKEIKNDLKLGINKFVLCGFLIEHCVSATAIDLANTICSSGGEVYVCSDLVASRLEKYKTDVVASTIYELQENGVQFKPWESIQP